jgi:hypothetical protein
MKHTDDLFEGFQMDMLVGAVPVEQKKSYVIGFDTGNTFYEVTADAMSEHEAKRTAWRSLTDEQRNNVASIECLGEA